MKESLRQCHEMFESVLVMLGSNPPGKKNQRKVPRRIVKSEREKQKREHLNELFFELSSAIGNLIFFA